ncbi:heme A synthase [Pseudoduganella sp. GCM10020061]|uniref:COX15/CtaA family protein n=1 Tax=Pseudoduganella sp. GCM10020061 TaxID=3317345 RepID=UPI00363E098E
MSPSHLFLMSATALAVCTVPLLVVLRSRDTDKFRKLVRVSMFLTLELIAFGAFTRLTDSGLGCPDWPGCYGMANPFLAHDHIVAAEEIMPHGPVTVMKAWIEMIHRFLAMAIGLMSIVVLAWSWRLWKKTGQARYAPGLPLAILLWICLTGAFGAWTVTLKLQPVIVSGHLMLGMGTLALFTWLYCRQQAVYAPSASAPVAPGIRALAALGGAVTALQVALGGWVSTNYATLACNDYPLCGGQVVPDMDFEHGFTLWRELGMTAAGHYLPFQALTAIHWVHRNFALVVFALLAVLLVRAWKVEHLRPLARGVAVVLALQALTGISTIYLSTPLAIAVLHNAGAAVLVLLMTMLNYRAKPHAPQA